MDRYDALVCRAGRDGKNRWIKIGAAFPTRNGGWAVMLDALPLPDKDGRCSVLLSEPRRREDRAHQPNAKAEAEAHAAQAETPTTEDILDDEIPF